MEDSQAPGAQAAAAATAKPRAREVPARYLQPRPAPAAGARSAAGRSRPGGGGGGLGSWVSASELDLPTCGSTPLYVHSVHSTAATAKPKPRTAAGLTAAAAPPPLPPHHDTAPLADARSGRGRAAAPPAIEVPPAPAVPGAGAANGGAFISPGSERSAGGDSDSDGPTAWPLSKAQRRQTQMQQDGPAPAAAPAAALRAAGPPSAAAAAALAAARGPLAPRAGFSVDTGMAAITQGSAAGAGSAAAAAAAERRRKLEEFRQQKAAAAAAAAAGSGVPPVSGGSAESGRGDAGTFRQPAPKAPGSVFRATAAMLGGDGPSSARRPGGTWRTGPTARGNTLVTPRSSGLAREPSPTSSVGSAASAGGAAGNSKAQRPTADLSLSAFKATMAALQQGRGGSPGLPLPSSEGRAAQGTVPRLPLNMLAGAAGVTPPSAAAPRAQAPTQQQAPVQQQQQQEQPPQVPAATPPPPPSDAPAVGGLTPRQLGASRIPRTPSGIPRPPDEAAPAPDPQRTWEAAQVALPDATPRSLGMWRDTPSARRPSQLPRTPSLPGAATAAAGPAGNAAAAVAELVKSFELQPSAQRGGERPETPPLLRRDLEGQPQGVGSPSTPRMGGGNGGGATAAAAAAAALGTPRSRGVFNAGATAASGRQQQQQVSPPSARRTPRAGGIYSQQRQQQQGTAAAPGGSLTPRNLTPSRGGQLTPRGAGIGQGGASSARTPVGRGGSLTPRGTAVAPPAQQQAPQPQQQQPPPQQQQQQHIPIQQHQEVVSVAAARPEDQATALKDRVRLLRMAELQYRFLRARAAAAHEARKSKGEHALACVATAVVDLRTQVAALQAAADEAAWNEAALAALGEQLPVLRAWRLRQTTHAEALSGLQASLRAAVSRLPLVNGATAGPNAAAPDAAALLAVVRRGAEAAARMAPALARLTGGSADKQVPLPEGPEPPSSSPSDHHHHQQQQQQHQGVAVTAAYARDLLDLAADEMRRLGALEARMAQLSDAALYAASLQVQLAQMGKGPGTAAEANVA